MQRALERFHAWLLYNQKERKKQSVDVPSSNEKQVMRHKKNKKKPNFVLVFSLQVYLRTR